MEHHHNAQTYHISPLAHWYGPHVKASKRTVKKRNTKILMITTFFLATWTSSTYEVFLLFLNKCILEISKPLFATSYVVVIFFYVGRFAPPPPFLGTQNFEKFYNFSNAGLSYIILFLFFSFLQAGFKYETRNDQIFTQVKLFDKNVLC